MTHGDMRFGPRAFAGSILGIAVAALFSAFLTAVRTLRTVPDSSFDLLAPLATLLQPADLGGWITLASILLFGAMCGLACAALPAARRGVQARQNS